MIAALVVAVALMVGLAAWRGLEEFTTLLNRKGEP